MKMINGDNNCPKGYGFCTYNDPDTAASAIRNMNKLTIINRDLSVNYASDKQSCTVLLPEDVRDRDKSEIISIAGEKGELLEP